MLATGNSDPSQRPGMANAKSTPADLNGVKHRISRVLILAVLGIATGGWLYFLTKLSVSLVQMI